MNSDSQVLVAIDHTHTIVSICTEDEGSWLAVQATKCNRVEQVAESVARSYLFMTVGERWPRGVVKC